MYFVLNALIAALQQLKAVLHKVEIQYQSFASDGTMRHRLYLLAKSKIGSDASPLDIVNDDLGCAESVTTILKELIDFPVITGTWTLNDMLSKDPRFQRGYGGQTEGRIIISPTGTGNGTIRGHVGIMGPGGVIMSATSADGIWRQNYTVEKWKNRYAAEGRLPIYYYDIIG